MNYLNCLGKSIRIIIKLRIVRDRIIHLRIWITLLHWIKILWIIYIFTIILFVHFLSIFFFNFQLKFNRIWLLLIDLKNLSLILLFLYNLITIILSLAWNILLLNYQLTLPQLFILNYDYAFIIFIIKSLEMLLRLQYATFQIYLLTLRRTKLIFICQFYGIFLSRILNWELFEIWLSFLCKMLLNLFWVWVSFLINLFCKFYFLLLWLFA